MPLEAEGLIGGLSRTSCRPCDGSSSRSSGGSGGRSWKITCCAQKCAQLSLTVAGGGWHHCGVNGRQFISRVRKWARARNLEVRFVASEGPGSHGTLYAGHRKTAVKDRKKEIGKGLLARMLADLGIDREEF